MVWFASRPGVPQLHFFELICLESNTEDGKAIFLKANSLARKAAHKDGQG
jgi:hypothetical protein